MKKQILIAILLLLSFQVSFSQITVNEDKLADALKEKMMDEITSKIRSSVESGEQWVADQTYFSVVLEPFESFGIDPGNPNFLNSAYDLHSKIEKRLQQDPNLRYSSELQTELKDIVVGSLKTYAGTFIDDDSKEIYDQVTALYTSGQEKISELLDAASGINNLDPGDEDYESEIVSILNNYGIESDYFFIIDDLSRVYDEFQQKTATPIDVLTKVTSAVRSNDPVYKIQMLLDLGETYGGNIPIIGDLVTPIFTIGKGVLDAALRLESVLEKNLNQGCISPAGGTYGSTNDNKRTRFIKKYPNVERACPLNQTVYSPVYNNIYFNTADENELFFYMKNVWLRGKKDKLHNGANDIRASIQWLRQHEQLEKAVDLDFIFTSYQKEYGWTSYSKALDERIKQMGALFRSSYQTVQSCNDEKLEKFYMEKLGFNWVTRLLQMAELQFDWQDLKYFNAYWEEEIKNRMIHNYYLSKHKDNLNNLDRIINSLKDNTPVNFYGTVTEFNGTPIKDVNLYTGLNSMFETGDKCHKTVTSGSGSYSYYLLLSLSYNNNTTVSASLPDGRTIIEDVAVHPDKKRYYNVNLIMPYIPEQDTSTTNTQDTTTISPGETTPPDVDTTTVPEVTTCDDPNAEPVLDPGTGQVTCVCKQNYKENPSTGLCVIDIASMLSNSDCANDPYAVAEWDYENERVICNCVDFYIWDGAKKKCVPDIQDILSNSDCSQWPNTEAKWDYATEAPYCDCINGFEWNEDYTQCISREDKLVAQSDCSHYPNTSPVWDAASQEVVCDCLPGYVWNNDYSACISESQEAVQNMDCSQFPNTNAKWDASTQQPYCDCLPGYKWNSDYTACEKEQTQSSTNVAQQTVDCSLIPNSEPVFDPYLNKTVCNCKAGYEWNTNFTACIPIKRQPDVNWVDVLTTTIDIINTATGNTGGNFPTSGVTGTGANQPPVVHQSNCNDQQQQGGDAPEIHQINLGQSIGSFVLDYDVYSVKDQIIVTQGGRTIYNSGCVSGSNSVRLNLSGFSSQISVRVNPNCDGTSSTQWRFTVHCPDSY